MNTFTIDGFARACKQAMAAASDRHAAARALLQQTITENSVEHMIEILDAAIPAGADIGEMVFHVSPELTMLYGRIPGRFQSAIHDHTMFACIAQLTGEERNCIFEPAPDGEGLHMVRDVTVRPGEVLALPADAIHCIENPGEETASALHIYGGDFNAAMSSRRLWTAEGQQERPFAFDVLLRESAILMKRAGNELGLAKLVEAVPATKEMVAAL